MSAKGGSEGISAITIVGIMFVGLKLAGIITWSWWWVTAPFWIPIVLTTVIFLGLVMAGLLGERKRRRR